MTEMCEPGRAFQSTSTGRLLVKLQGGKWLAVGKFGWRMVPEGVIDREMHFPPWLEIISVQDFLAVPWAPVPARLDSSANVPQEAKDALQRSFGEVI